MAFRPAERIRHASITDTQLGSRSVASKIEQFRADSGKGAYRAQVAEMRKLDSQVMLGGVPANIAEDVRVLFFNAIKEEQNPKLLSLQLAMTETPKGHGSVRFQYLVNFESGQVIRRAATQFVVEHTKWLTELSINQKFNRVTADVGDVVYADRTNALNPINKNLLKEDPTFEIWDPIKRGFRKVNGAALNAEKFVLIGEELMKRLQYRQLWDRSTTPFGLKNDRVLRSREEINTAEVRYFDSDNPNMLPTHHGWRE